MSAPRPSLRGYDVRSTLRPSIHGTEGEKSGEWRVASCEQPLRAELSLKPYAPKTPLIIWTPRLAREVCITS